MRITSHREKFIKKNGNRNIQCIITTENENERFNSPCFINKKNVPSCSFCGSTQSGENISNCSKNLQYQREYCGYVVSKKDKGNIHFV